VATALSVIMAHHGVNKRMYRCAHCGFIGDPSAFRSGRGREVAEHPDHHYCPQCEGSIDWYGFHVLRVAN
jgi:rubredoxin